MPDLNSIPYWECETASCWEVVVVGKTDIYVVRYNNLHHLNPDVQYDYSCTCPKYKYGRGAYCKHILAVKDKRCGWMQFTDGGEPKQMSDGLCCPKCGKQVTSRLWGV